MKRILIPIMLAVAIVLIYQSGRYLETHNTPDPRGTLHANVSDNTKSVLLIGVDGKQADFLQVLVFDKQTVTQIPIDRDTMTPITILSVLGKPNGKRVAQISLAHGFGDGREQSCELTVEAVSNLLGGREIDYYVAMDLDGIAALNDAVGGVTVTLEDDFSAWDASMTPGTTLTLHGKQAEIFVRARQGMDDDTNAARMARQEVYITQLLAQVEDYEELYEAMSPHIITNAPRGTLINLASRKYERTTVTLPGEHVIGADGFMQFIGGIP